jgi:hypothetical protein
MAKLHKKLGNEPAMARHHIHFCSEGRLHILGSLHNLFEKDRSQSSQWQYPKVQISSFTKRSISHLSVSAAKNMRLKAKGVRLGKPEP